MKNSQKKKVHNAPKCLNNKPIRPANTVDLEHHKK